jgi:hypothetical protein
VAQSKPITTKDTEARIDLRASGVYHRSATIPLQEMFFMTGTSKSASTLFIATLLLLATASAQTAMPKPGPEHKRLDYFTGNWTCDSDLKPGPMGPGGKMTSSDELKWMDGGYFVVMNSKFSGAAMNGSSIAFLGYDFAEKKYTYNEFNSTGEAVVSKGTVSGDDWTWIGDMKEPAGKGRFSEKILSPTSYSFKFELSTDGANWMQVLDGKCTKHK